MKNQRQGQTNESLYQARILLDAWQANCTNAKATSLDQVYASALWLQLEQCYRQLLAEYAGLYAVSPPGEVAVLIEALQQRSLPVSFAERLEEEEQSGVVRQIRQQLDARLSNVEVKAILSPVDLVADFSQLQTCYSRLQQLVDVLREYSREE